MMNDERSPRFAVELADLTKTFTHGGHHAVRGLCLKIPKGSTFGFIGPNGAGKTTTIKMMMGLLRITAGEAMVAGVDVKANPDLVKQRVGYVPEQQFIYGWMRVGEVIGFCRSFHPTWNDGLCAELLDLFELEPNKKVKQLSRGMGAKLSLLLAMSHEPELLVLDEPTGGLDPIVREEFLNGVLQGTLRKPEQTVLFSSHTLGDVQRLADTIGIIHDGDLLLHSPVDRILSRTKRIRAVLEDGRLPTRAPEGTIWQDVRRREWLVTVADFSADTVERLRTANPVGTVEVIDLSLEDIFKDYVKGRRAIA